MTILDMAKEAYGVNEYHAGSACNAMNTVAHSIRLTSGSLLTVRLLSKRDFYDVTRLFYQAPVFDEFYTVDDYCDEKRQTEHLLRSNLSLRWREHDDFQVAWDENLAFTLCGGIYSPNLMCCEYLMVLHGVLQATRHRDSWSYDTVVELINPLDGVQFVNFVLRGNDLFILDHHLQELDVCSLLSRSL